MNQQIKLSQAIQYVIIGLAVVLFLLVWPIGIIHNTEVSKSGEVVARESDPISVENNATQMFVAQGDNLSAVDLYVCNDMQGETITFRLYDASYTEIFNTFYIVKSNAKLPGFVHIPIDYELVKDQEYYYTLEGLTADLYVNYEDYYESSSVANGILAYAGVEVPGYNIIIRYEYSANFSWWIIILIAVVIIAATVGLVYVTKLIFAKKVNDKEFKVQRVFQYIGNPLLVIAAVISLYSIFPGKVFGTGVVNYLFYDVSILMLAAFLFYGINYKRGHNRDLMTVSYLKEHFTDWLQIWAFAGVIYGCCQYMNALYDIYQYKAVCNIIIFICLSEIVKYSKKELINWVNLVYLIVIGVLLYFFYQPGKWTVEDPTIIKKELAVIVLIGFTIVNLVRILIKKQVGKPKLPFAIVTTVMIVLLVIFRNTRTWPIFVLVMFGIFYIRYTVWDKKEALLQNFTNGLLIHFACGVVYSMLYRPFHLFHHYRYPLFFHTVTITATYLTLILAAALIKLLVKYNKEKNLKACYKELFVYGVVLAYLFMTLTRTGYIAAIVMVNAVFLIFAILYEKKKILGFVKGIGVTIAAMCLCFPICFTATRTIPAVVNEPYIYDTELFDASILKGCPPDSSQYMYLGRFLELTGYRLFGYHADRFESSMDTSEEIHTLDKVVLLASNNEEQVTDQMETLSAEQQAGVSNGRFDIFKAYIAQWNLWGHDEMGAPLEGGEIAVHAHNIYLQVIHDHGLIVGILFLIYGIYTFICTLFYFLKNKEKDLYTLLPVAVFIAFAVAGLTEWIFHPCNPIGCSLFIIITPLMFGFKKDKIVG